MLQGFSIFRFLRSYNSYLNARDVAAHMVDLFIDLQNEEVPSPAQGKDTVSPCPSTADAFKSTQSSNCWPLPLAADLRAAVSKQQLHSADNSHSDQADSPDRPGETLSQLVRAVQKGGSLIAIVGPVGCGKTTLLTELMCQLQLSPGKQAHDSIAYTSQKPWIPRGSLASTITFTGGGSDGCSKAAVAEDEWLGDVLDGWLRPSPRP